MKINSTVCDYRSKNYNPAFGAKFSENTNNYLKDLGYHYLTKYGEHSDEFYTYKDCINKLKNTCENVTINMLKTNREGMLTEIVAPNTNLRTAKPNNGVFNMAYLVGLINTLYKFETEYNCEQNPNHLKTIIDSIFQR